MIFMKKRWICFLNVTRDFKRTKTKQVCIILAERDQKQNVLKMNNSYVLSCSEVKMAVFTHVWAVHVSLTQRKAIALRWVIPSFEALDLQKLFISSVSPSIVNDQSHSNSDNVVIATGSSPYSCSCSKDYHAKESWSNCFWFECEVSFSCAAAKQFAMVIGLRMRTPGKVANVF